MAGQPSAGALDGAWPRGEGVATSQYGVDAGLWWPDDLAYIKSPIALPTLSTLPNLGPRLPV